MRYVRSVRHRSGEYPVTVAVGIARELADAIRETAGGGRCVVIADSELDRLYPDLLEGISRVVFPGGERSKSREQWAAITDQLISLGADRHTMLVSFGGGVASDLTGFVAATYMRGIRWVALPTSTLAMVDASVGGKTGVDVPAGKNLVGAFHPPSAVFCDPVLLDTLPLRSFREGLVEAIKHGAIASEEYWDWLGDNVEATLARDHATLAELVAVSVGIKADVVESDELETGRRAILNAGHTVGHAIEQVTGYGMPHGEAVSIGLVEETAVAEATGITVKETTDSVRTMLERFGLPTAWPPSIDRTAVRAAMITDKKNTAGTIRASLISRIGSAAVDPITGNWTFPLDW